MKKKNLKKSKNMNMVIYFHKGKARIINLNDEEYLNFINLTAEEFLNYITLKWKK